MNPFGLQALLNAKQAEWKAARSRTGMTLGSFIAALEKLLPEADVFFDFCYLRPTDFASYRGYYSDLSLGFSVDHEYVKAGELLASAKKCLGKTFEGYKGGDFVMDADTPLWVANYGDTGWRIVGVRVEDYTFTNPPSQSAFIEAKRDEDDPE